MAGNAQLYEHFEPAERLTLILEALARGNTGEADRLSGGCPRKTYTMRDADFCERLDICFDIMAVACIDLRCLVGKLESLEWAIAGMRLMSTHHHITATFAFMEGERLGKRQPQMDFFRRRPETPIDATSDDETDEDGVSDDDDGEPPRFSQYHHGAFATRMMAVEDRMQETTDLSLLAMHRAASFVVQQLVDVWTAFGRFCHDRLGVSAATLLAAWEFPTGTEVTETLRRYPDTHPDEAQVDVYYGLYRNAWDHKFAEAR